jgi:hypothetical protein
MKATIPAWVEGDYLNLGQVLALIGENDCVWLLHDFEGVTLPGSHLSASQLEQRNRDGQRVEFHWASLTKFANHVDQMVNGRLSALAMGNPEEAAHFVLEAFDSSEWIIEASEDNAWALEALSRVTALAR